MGEKRKVSWGIGFVSAVFVLNGLLGIETSAMAQATRTIKFGANMMLSGPGAPWGLPIIRSLSLGAQKVNDSGGFTVDKTKYKWELITCDNKQIPGEAAKCANTLIYGDKVSFMCIGGGSNALAAVPILKEANML